MLTLPPLCLPTCSSPCLRVSFWLSIQSPSLNLPHFASYLFQIGCLTMCTPLHKPRCTAKYQSALYHWPGQLPSVLLQILVAAHAGIQGTLATVFPSCQCQGANVAVHLQLPVVHWHSPHRLQPSGPSSGSQQSL